MTLDGESRILRRHPLAIVFDMNQLLAAEFHGDRDTTGTGINRILDQLLDDRGGTLDDLAGGNLIREIRRQLVNLAHALKSSVCGGRSPASRR